MRRFQRPQPPSTSSAQHRQQRVHVTWQRIGHPAHGMGSQSPRYVAPQTLIAALHPFADQSGLQLAYTSDTVEGLTTRGVTGAYTTEEALRRLLAGSGLTYRFTGASTVTLERAATPQDSGALQEKSVLHVAAISVEAQRPPAGEILPIEPITVQERAATTGYISRRATTGTKTDTPLLEIPQAIDVINREQLDAQQLLTIPEALSWVPGVSDENSRAGFDRFMIRGFSAADVIFLDGLRVDPRFWISQEVFGLERIEVLKGPASVLYGQVAPGGILNLISKRPLRESRRLRRLRG